MKSYNIPIANVVQHNHWSGKNCPRNLRSGEKGIDWNDFINMIMKGSGQHDKSSQETQESVPYTGNLLRRGSTGKEVERIQKAVNVAVDGIFGPMTERAVKAYQKRHGLAVDGIIGPKTWSAIFNKRI